MAMVVSLFVYCFFLMKNTQCSFISSLANERAMPEIYHHLTPTAGLFSRAFTVTGVELVLYLGHGIPADQRGRVNRFASLMPKPKYNKVIVLTPHKVTVAWNPKTLEWCGNPCSLYLLHRVYLHTCVCTRIFIQDTGRYLSFFLICLRITLRLSTRRSSHKRGSGVLGAGSSRK